MWCTIYAKHCRMEGTQDDEASPFFQTQSGKKVERIAQEVRRLGESLQVANLTPVNIRKTIATRVRTTFHTTE